MGKISKKLISIAFTNKENEIVDEDNSKNITTTIELNNNNYQIDLENNIIENEEDNQIKSDKDENNF